MTIVVVSVIVTKNEQVTHKWIHTKNRDHWLAIILVTVIATIAVVTCFVNGTNNQDREDDDQEKEGQ